MKTYKEHDFLFKKLSEIAPADLMDFTFPFLTEWIDFEKSRRASVDLNEIMHKDDKLYADTVLICPNRYSTPDQPRVALVHLEFQSYRQSGGKHKFAERMFRYFCRLYGIYGEYMPEKGEYEHYKGHKIYYVPLAILSDGCPPDIPIEYNLTNEHIAENINDLMGNTEHDISLEAAPIGAFSISNYEYIKMHLGEFHWTKVLDDHPGNIAASCLLGKTRHADKDKPSMKLESLKTLYGYGPSRKLNRYEFELLFAFIEEYLELDDNHEDYFRTLLKVFANTEDSQLGGAIMEDYREFTTKWGKRGAVESTREAIIKIVAKKTDLTPEKVFKELEEELHSLHFENHSEVLSKTINQMDDITDITRAKYIIMETSDEESHIR